MFFPRILNEEGHEQLYIQKQDRKKKKKGHIGYNWSVLIACC